MRTVSAGTNVRLYFLDDGDPVAVTLFYGALADALRAGRREPQEVQASLWIATENDVVPFLDLDDG